jgi:hypothetical protein
MGKIYADGGGVKAFWVGNGLNVVKIFPVSPLILRLTWHIESVLISGIRYKVCFVRTIQSLSREILGLRIGRF